MTNTRFDEETGEFVVEVEEEIGTLVEFRNIGVLREAE